MSVQDDLNGKVLVIETRCKGACDLVANARTFAASLRSLHFEGYDVTQVTIKGVAVRNDVPTMPAHDLTMHGASGELRESGQKQGKT